MPLQNYSIGDFEATILRKILQNSLLQSAVLTPGATVAFGTIPSGGAIQTFDFSEGVKSYSAAGTVVVVASATDVFTIYGSATAGVYITKIEVSGFQTTAALARLALIKRSTLDTGGTPVALSAIPHDASDPASSVVVNTYTANPAVLGAVVGNIDVAYVIIPLATGATGSGYPYTFNFGERAKVVFLNGVNQGLALNLNAVTFAGCTLAIRVEWYEI